MNRAHRHQLRAACARVVVVVVIGLAAFFAATAGEQRQPETTQSSTVLPPEDVDAGRLSSRETAESTVPQPGRETQVNELTIEELEALGLDHGPYAVTAYGETASNPIYRVRPGQQLTIPFTVENSGDFADSYDIEVASSSSLIDATEVPHTLALSPGEKRVYVLRLKVPSDQPDGLLDEIDVTVTSRFTLGSFRVTVESTGATVTEPEVVSTTTADLHRAENRGVVLAVDVGDDSVLALDKDGSVWAWGDNEKGGLGDGTFTDRLVPTRVGADSNWTAISLDSMVSLAVKADGSLWGWGRGLPVGQRGSWAIVDSRTPTCIDSESTWAAVSTCWGHVLALQQDGSLWGWGFNDGGRLGTGDTERRLFPVRIGSDTDWAVAVAGRTHSLGLKNDGSLWCWGIRAPGGQTSEEPNPCLIPTRVGSDSDWVAVSAGEGYSLALKKDGSLWGWGWNDFGQLGDGTTTNRMVLARVGSDSDWVAMSAGWRASLGVKKDGSLWGWGSTLYAGMGGSVDDNRLVPTRIGSDSDWTAVDCDSSNSAALKEDGSLWVWGRNGNGPAPGKVVWP